METDLDMAMCQSLVRAREAERAHIAREVHDQLIQLIVGCTYTLADIRAYPIAEADPRLLQLHDQLRMLMSEARNLCTDLRPISCAPGGFRAAIQTWIHAIQARSPLTITLAFAGSETPPLAEATQRCVQRILQEALANVIQHAEASCVSVELALLPDLIELRVEDNGKGFAVPACQTLQTSHHFGLLGIRERVALGQGVLTIDSQIGHGTCLSVQLPRQHLSYRQIGAEEVNYDPLS